MAQPLPDRDADTRSPRTTADLRQWIREHVTLDEGKLAGRYWRIEQGIARQRGDVVTAFIDARAGHRAAASADRGIEARGDQGALRGLRRQDGAAPAS